MKYVLASYIDGDTQDEIVSDPLDFKDAMEIYARTMGVDIKALGIEEGQEQECKLPKKEIVCLRPATADELIVNEEGQLMVDSVLEDYPQERFQEAFDKAVEEMGGVVADYESDEFTNEFGRQLKLMATADIMNSLIRKGDVEMYMEDGETKYRAPAFS